MEKRHFSVEVLGRLIGSVEAYVLEGVVHAHLTCVHDLTSVRLPKWCYDGNYRRHCWHYR